MSPEQGSLGSEKGSNVLLLLVGVLIRLIQLMVLDPMVFVGWAGVCDLPRLVGACNERHRK